MPVQWAYRFLKRPGSIQLLLLSFPLSTSREITPSQLMLPTLLLRACWLSIVQSASADAV